MAITIYKEGYIPGVYPRKALKGYLQFQQMQAGTISADRTRGARRFSDAIADEWLEKGIWNGQTHHAYMKRLEEFFDFDTLENQTDEQILYAVDQLRKDFLTYSTYDQVLDWRLKRLTASLDLNPEVLSNNHAYFDRGIKYAKKTNLFNSEAWAVIENEINSHQRMVVFTDNHRDLNTFLWLLFFESEVKEVIVFCKSNPLIHEPAAGDFKLKRTFQWDVNLHIELCTAKNAGYDLRDKSLAEKLRPYINEQIPIVVIGEDAVLTFEGADFQYTAFLPLKGDKACKYAGVLPTFSEKTVRTMIKKLNPVWPYPFKRYFSGVEHSTYNLISNVEYDKDRYMNMYSLTYDKSEFSNFTIQGNPWGKILQERKNNLHQLIDKHYGARVKCNSKREQQSDGRTIRMDVLHFLNPKTRVKPFLAQDKGKELFDIREFAKKTPSEIPLFFINFLYFATGKLVDMHDSKRHEAEKIKQTNFFIDGIYNEKKDKSTLPLYNKGYVAESKEGFLTFGNQALSEGWIRINNFECTWGAEAVNSHEDRDLIVYTPHLSKRDAERFHGDFHQFEKSVGEGRINLLVVNDTLVCARKGSLRLSPFGVIFSFKPDGEEKLMKQIGMTPQEDGYYEIPEPLSLAISLPENDAYVWKYNGANMLFKDGKDLMADEQMAKENFAREGWYDPLSMQTQETQVQQWVRGPRSVIGVDEQNNPFMAVFSGRTKESAGARFDEMNALLKANIPGIKDAVNLDGGASACLGMIVKGEFFELSLPC
ncbi:MAG: phosphodiester glycosidase family protein, partial [Thermotogota bacterium]